MQVQKERKLKSQSERKKSSFPAGKEESQQKNQGSRGNRRFRGMKVIGRGGVCQTRLVYEGNDAQQ